MTDYKHILDAYWPVIEKAVHVQDYYAGRVDGTPRICSDAVGELIMALIEARKACPVKREIIEVEDGDNS